MSMSVCHRSTFKESMRKPILRDPEEACLPCTPKTKNEKRVATASKDERKPFKRKVGMDAPPRCCWKRSTVRNGAQRHRGISAHKRIRSLFVACWERHLPTCLIAPGVNGCKSLPNYEKSYAEFCNRRIKRARNHR